ncbi:DUF3108 domain-containing protein [Ideonella sp. DXS22W]|uniref:DUF3108 domain-containing protein n=1 Tax=Pseudaquabacterium inlustre TaxID=2984192 RepID=A0ABU9CN21_9BURK
MRHAAAPQPGRRLAGLAVAVLAVHALLIAWWAPGARQVGSGHGPSPRPMLLVPPPAVAPGAPGQPPAPATPTLPAEPAAPAVATAQPVPAPQPLGDAPGAAPADTAVPGEAVAATLPLRPAAPASQAAADVDPEAELGAPPPPAEGAPPPVYATRIPLPALLRYRVLSTPGGAAASLAPPSPQVGEARLLLRHDGQRYTLALDAQAGGRPLIEQLSTGGFDSAGFAPDRFTDRRRGRGWRAANFRRDTGRIGFSGPRIDYPLLPGTQDRLSAVAQLAAIVAAAPDTAAAGELRVFVADARGWAELWRWRAEGSETVDTPLGPLALARWRREPERPEGLRVEAWLDPARGHWPARLRYTLLRNGQVLDLLLAAEPSPPP